MATEIVPENESYVHYWIPRFMIGKGYGCKGMQLTIDMLSKNEDYERESLSVVPSNEDSIAFYQQIGFVLTDEYIEDERLMDYHVIK